jgi:UrcA family protein
MRNIITSTLNALLMGALAIPAAAETVSISVPYADLDLSSPQGMATLEGRIKAASKRICGSVEVRDIHDSVDHQRCVRATNASVSIELARVTGNPSLLALNEPRKPRR